MSIVNLMEMEKRFINDMSSNERLKERCYDNALKYYELDNIMDTINHIMYTSSKLELENMSDNGAWFRVNELNQNDLKELLTIMKQYEMSFIEYQLGAWFNSYRINLKHDNDLIINDIGNDLKEITMIGFRYK